MKELIGRGRVVNSVFWNLLGFGLPLFFGIFAIPHLIEGYGNDRFGFLTITWVIVGYFSIFDLGMGRALTKLVSERLGQFREIEIPSLVSTALIAVFTLGSLAGLLVFIASPFIASNVFNLESNFRIDATASLRVLGLTLPFVVVSAALVGLLEAHRRFKELSFVKMFMGISNFGAPLITLHFTNSLLVATAALAVVRVLTTCFYILTVRRTGAFNFQFVPERKYLKDLAGYGMWIAISNVISPLMAQLDKVVVGAALALTVLPYYSVPSDVINRLSFVPLAFCGVVFPYLATAFGQQSSISIRNIYYNSGRVMICVALPMALLIAVLAHDLMFIWLGADFAANSALIVQWLALGFFFNSIARVPATFLQANGRPDITAKLHILELPIYGILLYVLLEKYSVLGAAIAWTLRMFIDVAFLFVASVFFHKATRLVSYRLLGITILCSAAGALLLLAPIATQIVGSVGLLFICILFSLRFIRKIDLSHA